jgi:hypothetical protein
MTMNSQVAKGPHANDGELLALLDEQPMEQRVGLEAHVAHCEGCANRLDRLRAASGRVASAVASMDTPPLDVTRMQRRLATVRPPRSAATNAGFAWRAAAVVVLAAGVAAASPLRGWVVRHLQTPVPSTRVLPPSQPATPSPSPVANSAAGAVVWFTAQGNDLVIRFDAIPAGGTLDLTQSSDRQASAQIADGGNGESFLILPSELRVRNTAGSTADYRVTVPADVHTVRLIAGTASRSIDVTRGSSEKIRLGGSSW